MRRCSALVVAVTIGALTACSGSGSGSGSSGSAGAKSTAGATSTASPTSTQPPARAGVIDETAAQLAISRYDKAVAAAGKKRSIAGTKAVQTGPLLAATLADYRITQRSGKKATKSLALSAHGLVIPEVGHGRGWFLSAASSNGSGAEYISLFQQASAGGPWRKSLAVWLGGRSFPQADVTDSGAAHVADARATTRDTAAVAALARYLSTGKRAKSLKAIGDASYERKYLRRVQLDLKGAISTIRCVPTRGGPVAAVSTGTGTALVASMDCAITKKARPGWILSLRKEWKALANKSSNLRGFTVHETVQVAMTVAADGGGRVIGLSSSDTSITAH
jgi:hypothetical protein